MVKFNKKLTIEEFDSLSEKEQEEYINWIDNIYLKGGKDK